MVSLWVTMVGIITVATIIYGMLMGYHGWYH